MTNYDHLEQLQYALEDNETAFDAINLEMLTGEDIYEPMWSDDDD